MKYLKLWPIAAITITAVFLLSFAGCTTTQQRTAANTLQATEATSQAAVSAYYDGVIKGIISTNDVPTVSKAFNDFQSAYALAVVVAQNNTNALAPDALVQESAALVNLVTTVSKTK